MTVSYKELGLVNTRQMFKDAMAGGYAIPAYNFNNMEQLQAIVTACVQTGSPVILQVSKGARQYANATLLRWMARGAVEMMKEIGKPVPLCLHLDHGDSFELCKDCIDNGFSSVMIDGSHLPYEENVALTKKVVEYAHQHDVTVEGELGVLAGIEDEVSAEHHTYTDPAQVEDFVPELRFDILEEVSKRLPGFPIVLHGSSSVPQWAVEQINKYGGKLDNTAGIPEEQLRKAAKSAVCKINVDSDGRLVMTATIRKIFAEKPAEFDPRKYLGPAREALIKMYAEKNENVFGSAGRIK